MGNIRNFDEWKNIDEKFDAEIKNTEQKTDETDNIIVKETENSEPIIYSINGDTVTSNQPQISISDNGKSNKKSENNEVITDDELKSDIKKAAYAIRNVKDRLYASEISRMTGGDISDNTNKLRNIIDSFHKTQNQGFETNVKQLIPNSLSKSIEEQKENNPFIYIEIPENTEWKNKYSLSYDNIKDIYNTSGKTIGKGEYLLPFLFDDVYKISVNNIGDNYFIDNNNKKYIIEVKSPVSWMAFPSYDKHGGGIIQYLNNENLIKTKDNIVEIFKTAIAASILEYAQKRIKEDYSGGYLCLFAEKEPIIINNTNVGKRATTPIGMLFLNISDIKKSDIYINSQINSTETVDNNGSLLEQVKNKIDIILTDYTRVSTADFVFGYVHGEEKPIKCALKYDFLDIIQKYHGKTYVEKKKKGRPKGSTKNKNKSILSESLILTRDNFINEIYTK